MIPNSKMFGVASALTALGIGLVLVNWYVKPEATLAWMAALAVFVAMTAALRISQRTVRRCSGEATAVRSFESIATAVIFAAVMMGIPLALTLARAYGLIDNSDDVARRSNGVLTGAFLVMLGNLMPKNLPPLSMTQCDGARQQAFHRLAGWTWVLCGLASVVGWLALPVDAAEVATIVVVVIAMAVTIAQLWRLRRRKNKPAHGLN